MVSLGKKMKVHFQALLTGDPRYRYVPVILLLFSLLALKLSFLFFTDFGNNRLTLDEYTNLDYANSLRNSLTYSSPEGLAYRPPAYPVFLTLVKLVIGNKIIYYKIANILLNLGTIILVYFSISGPKRIWAAVFLACYPPFLFLYELVLAENLALFLTALLVRVYVAYQKDGRISYILAFGFVSGLLSLTRPEAAVYLLLAHLVLIFRDRRLVGSFLVMILLVQGWMIRNYLVINRYPVMSTNSAHTFYLATFPESTGTSIYSMEDITPYPTLAKDLARMHSMNEVGKYDYFSTMAWEYLKQNPGAYFSLMPVRILTLLAPESVVAQKLIQAGRFHLSNMFTMLFIAVAALWDILLWIALLYAVFRRNFDFMYLSLLLGMVLIVCIVIAEARYKMQIMPALVIGIFSSYYNHRNLKRFTTIR